MNWLLGIVAAVAFHPLPPPDAFVSQAHAIHGPRLGEYELNGTPVTVSGDPSSPHTLLLAGGGPVVRALSVGCPTPDAEVWEVPREADTWRQATADLAPRRAVVLRYGRPGAVHPVSDAGLDAASRFAVDAGLPLAGVDPRGLAGWTATVSPAAEVLTLDVPRHVSRREASQIAFALMRFAGSRFAATLLADRTRMLDAGINWDG